MLSRSHQIAISRTRNTGQVWDSLSTMMPWPPRSRRRCGRARCRGSWRAPPWPAAAPPPPPRSTAACRPPTPRRLQQASKHPIHRESATGLTGTINPLDLSSSHDSYSDRSKPTFALDHFPGGRHWRPCFLSHSLPLQIKEQLDGSLQEHDKGAPASSRTLLHLFADDVVVKESGEEGLFI